MAGTGVVAMFAHAYVATLAGGEGLDVLHVKGSAIDPSLGWEGRGASDADVLVRPSQVRRLVDRLEELGWTAVDDFATGSPFEHSRTMRHPLWGLLDVHRRVPGVTLADEEAFDRLWRERTSTSIAHVACWVPSLPAQVAVLVTHAPRSGFSYRAQADVRHSWGRADESLRRATRRLVADLGADLPFALGIGEDPAPHRHRRDYDLWLAVSQGSTRTREWRARIHAERRWDRKGVLAVRAALPNPGALAHRLGRPPTRTELAAEPFRRVARGLRELRRSGG